MQDPYSLAASLGIHIEHADLHHLGRDGDCNIDTGTIRLQAEMLPRLERSVLAHEISHFLRGDRRSMFGHYDARDERLADEFAARLLIDVEEYRLAEEKCGNYVEGIALELNVMDWVVEAFERTLSRISNYVYVNARHGVGQWDARFEVA